MVYFHSSKCFWNYFSNKAKKIFYTLFILCRFEPFAHIKARNLITRQKKKIAGLKASQRAF
jgi:hypothetical protein